MDVNEATPATEATPSDDARLLAAQAVEEASLVLHRTLDPRQATRAASKALSLLGDGPRVVDFVPQLVAHDLAAE
jgi:hypothetical protein